MIEYMVRRADPERPGGRGVVRHVHPAISFTRRDRSDQSSRDWLTISTLAATIGMEQRDNSMSAADRPSPPRRELRIARFLFQLFLLAMIVDIGGAFGLKYLSSALIVGYLVVNARHVRLPRAVVALEGTLFLAAPLALLAYSAMVMRLTLAEILPWLTYLSTWIVLPLLMQLDRQDAVALFTRFMYFGALLTLGLFVGLVLAFLAGRPDLIAQVNLFTAEHRLGYFGERPTGGTLSLFVPNVYFGWTLLLVPTAVLLSGRSRFRLGVVLLAVVATLSTGAIVFALAGVALLPLVGSRGASSRVLRGTLGVLAVVLIGVVALSLSPYAGALQLVLDKFSSGSESTSMKLGHIESIMQLFEVNPGYLLLGTGIGSSFYSIGVDQVVTNIEVSHFNLLRQYGVVYALAFFGYVGLLARALLRTDDTGRRLSVGLLTLFVAAGTNPLLLGPVFFLVLVLGRAYVLQHGRALATLPSAAAAAYGRS
jgi:hypothetical protein